MTPPDAQRAPRAFPAAEIAVGFVALCARAAHLHALHGSPLFSLLMGDALVYDEWARGIAAGRWLGEGVFYQAPLYPYVLGVLYRLFGHSLLAVKLFQALLGSAACVFVARAGRHYFDPATGLVAGLMLALYPTAVFFDGLIQKSSLDLFLVSAFLLLLSRADGGAPRARWLGMGLVLGLLALTRENSLALVIIALAALLLPDGGAGRRGKIVRASLLGAGMACVLLPVGLRNLAVGGEFHLTTSQFGPNFYIGNGPQANGTYVSLIPSRGDARFEARDAKVLAERAVGRVLSPGEVSRYWSALTVRRIVSEPGAWLKLMARKGLLLVNRVEFADTEDQTTHGDFSPLLRLLNPWFTFGLLVPLAGAGLFLALPRRRLGTLHLYLLIYSASVLVFYVFSRYRFPLVPVLVLFAAAGLTMARDALRRNPRRFVAAAATAVALAIAANWPLAGEQETAGRAAFQNNIAGALLRSGASLETALPYQVRAVQLNPRFAAGRRNLGGMLRSLGRPYEAMDQLLQALALAPTADVHTQIGLTLIDLGRPGEAVEHYRQAALLDPEDVENRRRLAALLARLGRQE